MTLDTLHSNDSQESYYGPPGNLEIPLHMINQQPVPFIALSSLSRSQYMMEYQSVIHSSNDSSNTLSSSSSNSLQTKAIARPKSSIS